VYLEFWGKVNSYYFYLTAKEREYYKGKISAEGGSALGGKINFYERKNMSEKDPVPEEQIRTEYGMKTRPEILARLKILKARNVWDEDAYPEGSQAPARGRQDTFDEFSVLSKYLSPAELAELDKVELNSERSTE
jgi:hypothetical protein